MPVLVTEAGGPIGRALVRALTVEGGQVRAYVSHDDPDLRALGAKVAIGDIAHEGRLESALEQVHTLVLLSVENPDASSLAEQAAVAARAAQGAGVQRIVLASSAGADPVSECALLAAAARAEESVRATGIENVVLRVAPVLGPGSMLCAYLSRVRRATIPRIPGDGRQQLNPVALSDVVAALVRADDRESGVAGVWGLGGPDVVTFDELAVLAGARRRAVHTRSLPGVAADVAAAWGCDLVADPGEAVRRFGLSPMPVRDALACC